MESQALHVQDMFQPIPGLISCWDGDHYQLLEWGPLSAVGMGTLSPVGMGTLSPVRMGTITLCTKRRQVADRYRILSIIVDTLIARTPQL